MMDSAELTTPPSTGVETKSKEFGNGGGEIDMLIGFFLMNGACIGISITDITLVIQHLLLFAVFFLLFGFCVICSCMRRRPRGFQGGADPVPRKKEESRRPTRSIAIALLGATKKSTTVGANGTVLSSSATPTAVTIASVAGPKTRKASGLLSSADVPASNSLTRPTFKCMVNRQIRQNRLSAGDLKAAGSSDPNNNQQQQSSTTAPLLVEKPPDLDREQFAASLTRKLSLLSTANHVVALPPDTVGNMDEVDWEEAGNSGDRELRKKPSTLSLRRSSHGSKRGRPSLLHPQNGLSGTAESTKAGLTVVAMSM